MKKMKLAALTALLLGLALPTYAMDSATLHNNPFRYRIIYADEAQVLYGDMQSLSSMETRDLPSSIENISLTVYQENYVSRPTAMDFAQGNTVASIAEYQATLYGNKAENRFRLEKSFSACYDAMGKEQDKSSIKEARFPSDIEDMYRTVFRLIRIRK